MKIHKVLMFGARDWTDENAVRREIRRLKRKYGNRLLIIEGGAPGADQMARVYGHMADVHVAEVVALWSTRHRAAGPQRNTMMLMMGPDEAICFHADLGKSKGSADMKKRCDRAGVPVKVVAG